MDVEMTESEPLEVEIIDNTKEAMQNFGFGYGVDSIVINRQQIEALLNGKTLAWNNGEYSGFLTYRENN